MLGGALVIASGISLAGPGPDAEPAVAGDSAETLRQQVEAGMTQLAQEEEAAQKSRDFARTACVVDKREQGEEVLELATDEILIIRDPSSGEQARRFAHDKLAAAADRMDLLVEDARTCGVSAQQLADRDKARTDQNKDSTIPAEDPTQGMGASPVPPVIGGSWPPVASGSE
jgi:hypothetical protein